MSHTSKVRDQLNNPERTADAQERTAARFRIRQVDAEQASAAPSARQTFLDITGLQHVLNVFRRHGKDRNGEPRQTYAQRMAVRHAWQEERRKSVVRRRAKPVVASQDETYATLSNGQRVRLANLQPA